VTGCVVTIECCTVGALCVQPGYILGPYGDEIVIERAQKIDLRTTGVSSTCGDASNEPSDPWCRDVFTPRSTDTTLYVAVKYKEILTRPVRIQPSGCGCTDTQCEFSRICDGYEIGILSDCPDSHKNPQNLVNDSVSLEKLITDQLPDCPECPTDPWVVLAKVKARCDGIIQEIDNCSCRRIVISFGRFWWRCMDETKNLIAPSVDTESQVNNSLEASLSSLPKEAKDAQPKPSSKKTTAPKGEK
jgi:hypothetical protein